MFGKKKSEELKDNLESGRKRYKDINSSWPHMDTKQRGGQIMGGWDSLFYVSRGGGRSRQATRENLVMRRGEQQETEIHFWHACPRCLPSLPRLWRWNLTSLLVPVAAQNVNCKQPRGHCRPPELPELTEKRNGQCGKWDRETAQGFTLLCMSLCLMKGAGAANPPISL